MKDRIGIETIFRDVLLTNYGSFWQHYALRSVVRSFGYASFRCEQSPWRGLRAELLIPIRLIQRWLCNLSAYSLKQMVLDIHKFVVRCRFILDYWCKIGFVFDRVHDNVKAYVAGGDSVWCMTDPHYFLLDKPASARRISYAVSSAWDKMSEDGCWKKNIQKVVDTFSAISVRENAGAQCIMHIVPNSHPAVVADPVLLLDQGSWLGVAKRNIRFHRKTLLYYAVNIRDGRSLNLEVMEKCAREFECDLRIIGIQGAEKHIPRKYRFSPSPTAFLSAVRDCSYFVTNSFHGLVFSLLFHKRFLFVCQSACLCGDQNVRQKEMLERVFLCDHMIGSTPTMDECVRILNKVVDWDRVDTILSMERRRSVGWLKRALS